MYTFHVAKTWYSGFCDILRCFLGNLFLLFIFMRQILVLLSASKTAIWNNRFVTSPAPYTVCTLLIICITIHPVAQNVYQRLLKSPFLSTLQVQINFTINIVRPYSLLNAYITILFHVACCLIMDHSLKVFLIYLFPKFPFSSSSSIFYKIIYTKAKNLILTIWSPTLELSCSLFSKVLRTQTQGTEFNSSVAMYKNRHSNIQPSSP